MSKLIDGQIIGKPQVDWSLRKGEEGWVLVDVFMLASLDIQIPLEVWCFGMFYFLGGPNTFWAGVLDVYSVGVVLSFF